MAHQIRRSWLVVPASDSKAVEAAAGSNPDVVVLDLMELVHEGTKHQARESMREAIGAAAVGGAEVFAQIDLELMYADLAASIWPGLHGVVLPRLESVAQVAEAEKLVAELEGRRGIIPGAIELVASFETAAGNYSAFDLAQASRRISSLTLGRADLVMDLRPEPNGEFHLMPYLMQRLVTIANASGKAPIGARWRAPARGLMAGPDDTHQAALRGRTIGFKGSFCILPEQVDSLNRGFTPADSELEEARAVVSAFAGSDGPGLRGDEIVHQSRASQANAVLDLARACDARDHAKAMVGQPVPD